ncbi:hypothetical protein HG530_007166 [Fusarium avenaceum]|nr:hypothetical protein HG530_007166 [Fusarium avenaceum]
MDDSDSSDEGSLFVSDSSSAVNEPDSSPCRKSSILSITSASSNEEAPQPWKHPRSPVQRTETSEHAHAIEPEPERMDIDYVVLNEATTNDMTNPHWDFPVTPFVPAPTYQGPADLASGIEHLETNQRQEQKELAQSISSLKTSIQTREASIADKTYMITHKEALSKLKQNLRSHNEEKDTLKKGRVFFKQHCEDKMALNDQPVAETLRWYTRSLQACDAAISTTKAQIDQERQKNAQCTADFKAQIDKDIAQVQRLEDRERDIIRNLEYYSVVKGLIKLGPHGMETLLTKLNYDNIPILKLVEEVQKRHSIA